MNSKSDDVGHVQLLVYRIPKKNHSAMAKLQKKLTQAYRNHGTLRSEFFQLDSLEPFMGFVNIGKMVEAGSDDEVWVEWDSYGDRKHRDQVVQKVNQDQSAGPMFGELMGLMSDGYQVIMGDFDRLEV